MNRRYSGKAQAGLWCLAGMVSASLAFWSVEGRGRADGGASVEVVARPAIARSELPRAPDPAGGPECFLGVVLAPAAVEVATEVAGRLQSVDVRVGDAVAAGEVLATLDRRALEHQRSVERAVLRNAEAQRRRRALEADRAEEAQRRRQGLDGLVSREQQEASRFDSAVAAVALEAAGAEVERAEAKIEQLETQLAKAEIRAPFAGRVAHRYLDAGTVAAAGTPVLRLISAETLITRFAVPPIQASGVTAGRPVRIEVEGLEAPLPGLVEHLAPEIDAASQMLFAEARLSAAKPSGVAVASGAVARVSLVPPEAGGGWAQTTCLTNRRSAGRAPIAGGR